MLNLEKHFSETCEQHPHLKLLESQWSFDKELISKALQNVSSVFPHYSQHDASHSRQLIVNIERMLGDKIKHLTATDSWLLLEAAYNHDIGMVITSRQMKDLDTAEFKSFVQKIASDDKNELKEFAAEWLAGGFKVPFGTISESKFFKYKQVIAEWFRKKHPENSANIVNDPLASIGLTSPRNELLPKRLFGVLADICRAHGQSFEQVMELPFSETGMATEDCHPRYIACLLRIADLLDIDDNRFCPVMVNMCDGGLPHISHLHQEKHNSIKHFRLDSERIEVRAEPPNPESYEVTFEWFQWLQDEHHKQNQRWDEIVPNKGHGKLPTLRTPEVGIKPPFLVLDKGKKPSFSFDHDAISDLVRGAGLYSDKFECIREILQNSVDATLLAAWDISKDTFINFNPLDPKLRNSLNKYPIKVTLDKLDPEFWLLKVTDNGIGISSTTLRYMFNIGASARNPEKKKIIQDMPIWYKPSGCFGIGLQSIFLISETVEIITKSRTSKECLQITIVKNIDFQISIKQLPAKNHSFGTTFKIKISPDRSFNNRRIPSNSSHIINKFDITNPDHDLTLLDIQHIKNSISAFSEHSIIPIKHQDSHTPPKPTSAYFSKNNNIVIHNISFGRFNHFSVEILFRGQKVNSHDINLRFISAEIDIYGFDAKEILSYSRDYILANKLDKVREKVILAIADYIPQIINNLDNEEKVFASAFMLMHTNITTYNEILKSYPIEAWNKELGEHCIPLGEIERDISDGKKWLGIAREYHYIDTTNKGNLKKIDKHRKLLIDADDLQIAYKYFFNNDIYVSFEKVNNSFKIGSDSPYKYFSICLSNESIIPTRDIKDFLKENKLPSYIFGIGNRLRVPAIKKYKQLILKDSSLNYSKVSRLCIEVKETIMLPIVIKKNRTFKTNLSNDFISWVQQNLKQKNIRKKEIKKLYRSLMKDLDLHE